MCHCWLVQQCRTAVVGSTAGQASIGTGSGMANGTQRQNAPVNLSEGQTFLSAFVGRQECPPRLNLSKLF